MHVRERLCCGIMQPEVVASGKWMSTSSLSTASNAFFRKEAGRLHDEIAVVNEPVVAPWLQVHALAMNWSSSPI